MDRRHFVKLGTLATTAALLAPAAAAAESSGPFTLSDLPVPFDALEPHIDAKTMEIHHDKHHKTYVDNLNKLIVGTGMETKTVEEILTNLGKLPEKVRTPIRNNAGGHYNHTLFWQMMSAKGGSPAGALAKAIDASFASTEAMYKELKASAMGQFGSGWAWVVSDKAGKLKILSTPNQNNPLMDGTGAPILGIDVWEHAYYLNYQNRRPDYITAFWNVVNWDVVAANFVD